MQHKRRTLTVSYTHSRDVIVPRIRIEGQWLGRAGFYVGDRVSVVVRKGKLVIIQAKGWTI